MTIKQCPHSTYIMYDEYESIIDREMNRTVSNNNLMSVHKFVFISIHRRMH